MLIKKYLIAAFALFGSALGAQEPWVNIPRSEPVIHRLEGLDEDRSIWVVFSKKFDSEKVLMRFPEDPNYRQQEGHFEASASQRGSGEFALLVYKKAAPSSPSVRDTVWQDPETGSFVRERHIETQEHLYILRFSHPNDSPLLFHKFVDSFKIQNDL